LSHLNFRASNRYMLRAVGPFRNKGSRMNITLANAEAALDDVQRDADKLRSRELRKAIAEYIEMQREAIKAVRRKMN
jgi:chromosomal replication initiation ATPase DnaA